MAQHTPPATKGGGPAPKGKPAKAAGDVKPGGMLTADAGPLPVWGWLAVGVAVVFLYRTVYKGGGTKAAPAASGVSNDVGGGDNYYLPQATYGPSGGADTGTQNSSPTLPDAFAQNAVDAYVSLEKLHSNDLYGYKDFGDYATHQSQGVQDFFNQVANSADFKANPNKVQDFFQENIARKALGLPYYIAGGVLVNPATGQPLNTPTAPIVDRGQSPSVSLPNGGASLR